MTSGMWKRFTGGTSGSRVFSAYLALVLLVAVVGPVLTMSVAEGRPGKKEPKIEVPAPGGSEGQPPQLVPDPEPAPEPMPQPPNRKPGLLQPVPSGSALAPAEPSGEGPFVMGPMMLLSSSVTPMLVAGNPPLLDGGVKVDPPAEGTFHYGDFGSGDINQPGVPLDFELTIDISSDGKTFDFTSNYPVTEVIVKGGDAAYSYRYPGGTYGDTGLVSPEANSGQVPALSHMIFYFGEIAVPEVGDLEVYKYLDADGSGRFDDEEMLRDWAFTLYDDEGDPVGSGLTDENGRLLFGDLAPGEYHATETLQTGWQNTTALTQYVTVAADGTASLWFGNRPLGGLIVYKYEDDNKSGRHDAGEAMLANWQFTLTTQGPDILSDGIGAAAISVIGDGLTAGDGELPFTGLTPGTYIVTETPQAGWTNVSPLVQTVPVESGKTAEVWFGNIPDPEGPELGDLIVHKYEDVNENGTRDSGEAMLEDWEFTVTREGQTAVEVMGSGLTDADGEVYFGGLVSGEYIVTETLESGWRNITPLVQTVEVTDGATAEVWFGNVEDFLPFTELDLAITKLADKENVGEGQLVTYTLTYWNLGDLQARDYTVVDDFDERYMTVVDATGGVVSNGKITWTLAGPLAKADGRRTLTYTMRVVADMPEGTTNIDNIVVIDHPRDDNKKNNTDDERVVVTEDEPYLPFTGSEYALLLGFAVAAAAFGLLLRPRTDNAA